MYGLLLEAIVHYIVSSYGEEKWEEIRKLAKLETVTFSTHKRYSETIIPDIAIACSEVLDRNVDDIMDAFGVCFVSFVGQYGYDRILKVLGRNMRDFLNGLDNLHEYLRFSYPKLRPPSFFCTNETKTGLTLHYRSKRRGFLHYVKGQIRQVGRLFYGIKIDIDVVSIETSEELTHVVFRLHFDNTAYKDELLKMQQEASKTLPIDSNVFFDLFPFHLVFNRSFDLRNVGSGISAILPSATGMKLDKLFTLIRPLIDFSWMEILGHTNSVFELRSNAPLKRCTTGIYLCTDFLQDNSSADSGEEKKDNEPEHTVFQEKDLGEIESSDDDDGNFLHLKGQMMYMREWECIIFLGTPIMESLDAMFKTGLYINDLSMHDSSRDLVLAGTQQSAELKLALDQEQQKSKILEESMRKLDAEMKRTDSLLYQMIPKPVADRLRRGEPAITTCQVFDNVTILFSDVVGFTNICSQISPMEVVSMLNAMYTKFDHLSERHSVYKVETIGDAYMVVSGAPEVTKYHAINICNMALDMMESMMDLKDPSTGGHMQIRVGVHSGTTVAGVVGIKMPRYCLFGDTVNTASRMETNGEAMKIHISQTTRESLTNYPYVVEERGSIPIKGKGSMKTYWLQGRDDKSIPTCPFSDIVGDLRETPKSGKGSGSLDLRSLYSPVSFDDVQRSKTPMIISTPVHRGNSRINLYSEDKPDSISKDKANGETVVANSNDKEFNYESNCKSITDVVKYSSRDRIRVSRFSNDDKSATCCLL